MGNFTRFTIEEGAPKEPDMTTDELLMLRQELPPRYAAPLEAQMEMAWLNGEDDLVATAVAIQKALGR